MKFENIEKGMTLKLAPHFRTCSRGIFGLDNIRHIEEKVGTPLLDIEFKVVGIDSNDNSIQVSYTSSRNGRCTSWLLAEMFDEVNAVEVLRTEIKELEAKVKLKTTQLKELIEVKESDLTPGAVFQRASYKVKIYKTHDGKWLRGGLNGNLDVLFSDGPVSSSFLLKSLNAHGAVLVK